MRRRISTTALVLTAALSPADMEEPLVEFDLIPLQGGELGHSETVAVGEDNHGGVAVTMAATIAGGFDNPIYLLWDRVFAGGTHGS